VCVFLWFVVWVLWQCKNKKLCPVNVKFQCSSITFLNTEFFSFLNKKSHAYAALLLEQLITSWYFYSLSSWKFTYLSIILVSKRNYWCMHQQYCLVLPFQLENEHVAPWRDWSKIKLLEIRHICLFSHSLFLGSCKSIVLCLTVGPMFL